MVYLLRSNRFWLVILGGVLIASAVTALALQQAPAGRALIFRDGELLENLVLAAVIEPFSLTVEYDAGVNVISVERGRIRVSEANCPDGICVRLGWVSGGAAPIVCLPNRLIIRFESGQAPDIDAIVG